MRASRKSLCCHSSEPKLLLPGVASDRHGANANQHSNPNPNYESSAVFDLCIRIRTKSPYITLKFSHYDRAGTWIF